ncbi:MAG: CoA transferase, partial [Actinomycetales bacterium]
AVQYDQTAWPALREAIGAAIATRSRDDWAEVFEGTDACAAPVLTMIEATRHPHLVARGTFVTIDGIEQPAPAPRFLRPDITVDEAT